LHFHVIRAGDIDRPTLSQRGDKRLLHQGDPVALRVLDLHAVLDAQHALLDLQQLIAVAILKYQRLANAQRLAVNLVHALAIPVLDPEIITDGGDLLAHLVAVVTAVGPATRPPLFASFLSSFLSSPESHDILQDLIVCNLFLKLCSWLTALTYPSVSLPAPVSLIPHRLLQAFFRLGREGGLQDLAGVFFHDGP